MTQWCGAFEASRLSYIARSAPVSVVSKPNAALDHLIFVDARHSERNNESLSHVRHSERSEESLLGLLSKSQRIDGPQ